MKQEAKVSFTVLPSRCDCFTTQAFTRTYEEQVMTKLNIHLATFRRRSDGMLSEIIDGLTRSNTLICLLETTRTST